MEESYQGGVAYEHDDNIRRLMQIITSNIKKISQKVSSMTKLVNQLQLPQEQQQELRNQLELIKHCLEEVENIHRINRIFMEALKLI